MEFHNFKPLKSVQKILAVSYSKFFGEIVKPISNFWKKLNNLSNAKILLLIASITFLLILFVWKLIPGGFSYTDYTDFNSIYLPVALNLLEGEGFTRDGDWVTTIPPGFPVLISLFFGLFGVFCHSVLNSMAVMVIIFSIGISIMIFLIGKHLWGNVGGFLVFLLWLTYPITLYLLKQPNSEIPFIFFILVSVYLFIKVEKNIFPYLGLFLCGISIGIAMLIRPIAIGIGLLLGITKWFTNSPKRTAFVGGLVIIFANFLTVLPWEMIVYNQTGKIIPLSSLGMTSMRLGFTFPVQTDTFREDFSGPRDILQLAFLLRENSQNVNTTSEFVNLLIDNFRQQPATFMKFLGLKLIKPWYGTDSGRLDKYILIIQLLYLILIIISIYLTIKKKNLPKNVIFLFLFLVFYFWSMTMVGMPLLRYLIPIFPILFLFLPVLFVENGEFLVKRR